MKKITAKINKILEDLDITSAPIDLDRIVDYLGLKIVYKPFDGDISGCLLRDKEGNAIIGINSAHHENRQRFTIAHEIGHYLLHKGEPTWIDRNNLERINFRSSFSDTVNPIEEIQANKFAAQLLMPREMLVEDILAFDNIEDIDFVSELANKYQVSKHALTIRLTHLNLT